MIILASLCIILVAQAFGDNYYYRPKVIKRVSTPETYDSYRAAIDDYTTIRDGYYDDARFYGRAGHGIYRDSKGRPITDFYDYPSSGKRVGRMAGLVDQERPRVIKRVSTPETYDHYRAAIDDHTTIRDGYYDDARFYGRAGHGIYRDSKGRPISDFYEYPSSGKRAGGMAGHIGHERPLLIKRVSTPETYDNYGAVIDDYTTIRDGYYDDARFYGRAGHGIYRDSKGRPITDFYDYPSSGKRAGGMAGHIGHERPLVVNRVSTPETYRSAFDDYTTIRDGYYEDRFY